MNERKLLFWAAFLLALVMTPEVARGNPEAAKSYVAPMVVPAAAFINDGQDPDGFDFRSGGIEGLGSPVEMVAPVYLPHGATITSFRAYIYDNSNTCGVGREDVDIFLLRTSLVDGVAETVAITASDGASGSVELVPTHTLNATRATVNNGSYHYWLHMRICSFSHRLNAVVIDY